MVNSGDIILILIAILFPPAAAAILTGCSVDLFITICLTILGYIPGHVFAFYLIYKKVQADERFGPHNTEYQGNHTWAPKGTQAVPANVPPPSYGATQA